MASPRVQGDADLPARHGGTSVPDVELQWLARARLGDVDAFGHLVRRHQSAVRLQLRRLLKDDRACADDLAQDTFVSAWKSLPEFRGDARLSTWLHRIAFRTWLMHRRARRADPVDWHGLVPDDEDAVAGAGGETTATRASAVLEAANTLLSLDLERALDQLSDAQRLAVLHCCVLELSNEEAATVLGLPLGTLKSHVLRGKQRLRELLRDWRPAAPVHPPPEDPTEGLEGPAS